MSDAYGEGMLGDTSEGKSGGDVGVVGKPVVDISEAVLLVPS